MAGFELAIQGGGQTLQRAWTSAELEKGVGWLKRMNARGHDIAIRPAGEHGLVLVAGLRSDGVARMADAGWTSAATIETSPGRYEAWVKLSEEPVRPVVLQAAAVYLSKSYGGDPPRDRARRTGGWPASRIRSRRSATRAASPMCWRRTVRARSRPRRRRSWRGSNSSGGSRSRNGRRRKRRSGQRSGAGSGTRAGSGDKL